MVGKQAYTIPVGILALQGDMSLHERALIELGATPQLIRSPEQLRKVRALVMPGGESSALLRLLEPLGMLKELRVFAAEGGSIFGTCAGAILLAGQVTNPGQESLGLIDMSIERNGWGRQIDSGDYPVEVRLPGSAYTKPMTFIRAPRITDVGPKAEAVAFRDGEPVLVRQGRLFAATFHPELSDDDWIYRFWLRIAAAKADKN